jgi:hypothetical protein
VDTLEVPTRAAKSAAVGPVVEGALVLFVPSGNGGQLKWKVIVTPNVEQERKDRVLVGAQRLLAKLDGVCGLVVFRQSVASDQVGCNAKTFG